MVAVFLLAAASAVTLGPDSPTARAASIGQLKQRITSGQQNVSALSGAVGSSSTRIGQLDASIATLGRRLTGIQADLDAKRAELTKLRGELGAARMRLAQLEAFEARAERVLAGQLVATYQSNTPDLVTVVLSATGFQDLLDQLSYMQRVRKQDVDIVRQVRAARRAVAAEATHLGRLEVREQALITQVRAERDALARTSAGLEQQRGALARFRNAKAGELANARAEVAHLQRRLSDSRPPRQRWPNARRSPRDRRAAEATASPAIAPSSGPVSANTSLAFPTAEGARAAEAVVARQGVDVFRPSDSARVCPSVRARMVLHSIGGLRSLRRPVLHCDGSLSTATATSTTATPDRSTSCRSARASAPAR